MPITRPFATPSESCGRFFCSVASARSSELCQRMDEPVEGPCIVASPWKTIYAAAPSNNGGRFCPWSTRLMRAPSSTLIHVAEGADLITFTMPMSVSRDDQINKYNVQTTRITDGRIMPFLIRGGTEQII